MNITLTREEAQQVLEILHYLEALNSDTERQKMQAIETLRARLAQPEPDYRDVVIKGDLWRIEFLPDHAASVVLVRANYEAQPEPEPWAGVDFDIKTAPPQRNWQGLTDEEIGDIIEQSEITLKNYCSEDKQKEYARAIEAKLREKNAPDL